jgi:hypothetical protein
MRQREDKPLSFCGKLKWNFSPNPNDPFLFFSSVYWASVFRKKIVLWNRTIAENNSTVVWFCKHQTVKSEKKRKKFFFAKFSINDTHEIEEEKNEINCLWKNMLKNSHLKEKVARSSSSSVATATARVTVLRNFSIFAGWSLAHARIIQNKKNSFFKKKNKYKSITMNSERICIFF